MTLATWPLPETFECDLKFIQVLPFIDDIKYPSLTRKTPRKLINRTYLGEMVDFDWLYMPLVGWLKGKMPANRLPNWIAIPGALAVKYAKSQIHPMRQNMRPIIHVNG